MSKRTVEAERYFGKMLRAPKTFNPKVETSLTRIEQQKRMNQFGWAVFLLLIGTIPVVVLLECLRVI